MKRLVSVVGLYFILIVGLSWEVGAYDKEDLEHLKRSIAAGDGNCPSCELSNANLSGANLTGADVADTQIDEKVAATNRLLSELFRRLAEEKKTKKHGEKPIRVAKLKERLKGSFGYKDIKIGMTRSELSDLGVCKNRSEQDLIFSVLKGDFSSISSVKCYDKRDWKFRLDFSSQKLKTISINLGLLSSDYYNYIYGLLRKNYLLDYGVTQRDVDLFNNGDKMFLYEVFEEG